MKQCLHKEIGDKCDIKKETFQLSMHTSNTIIHLIVNPSIEAKVKFLFKTNLYSYFKSKEKL